MAIGRNAGGVLAGLGALLAAGCWSGMAEARTNFALIVGVTKYPNVRNADLVGPNNDAELVRQYLTTAAPVPFAAENVKVLADGIADTAGSPTLGAIKDQMAALASKATRGDFVYIQLSGHGMQQPAVDPASEPDGMDEIFLPADIREWKDPKEGVPNAFVDDEIGKSLDAIRAKGAFVWLVIDACHSGTATRAAGLGEENVTERKLDPKQVGIPESAFEAAEKAAKAANPAGDEREGTRALALYANDPTNTKAETPTGANAIAPGGMVAFFAAQTVETTPEMPLPRGVDDAKKFGLFTYTIMQQLAENPAISYRQLGQAVMSAYSASNRTRPTPLFEGALDTPVFGTELGAAVQQWRVKVEPSGISLPAGRLHRLNPGTRLALLPSPSAALTDALGFVEVRSSDNLTARLAPVEAEGKAQVAPSAIPAGAYARMTDVAFDTELTVSRPSGNGHDKEAAAVQTILAGIGAGGKAPVKIRLVGPTEPADLKLAIMSEEEVALLVSDAGPNAKSATVGARAQMSSAPRLWFLPPTGEISVETGRRPPSIGFAGSTPEGLAAEIGDTLTRVFRATNLSRLAAASTFKPDEFDVAFRIVRSGDGGEEPVQAARMPRVHPDDQVHLAARNGSSRPVDMNVLYIGSDYSISHLYAERLHTDSKIDLPLAQFNDSSYGVERLVVVLTEGSAITTTEDLSFLAQAGVPTNTRGAGDGDGFSALLRTVGGAPSTRGAMKLSQSSGSRGALMIFPMENMPRE